MISRAAEEIKRVTLELGGKSANVIFADADLERAAGAAPYAVFDNAGQDCCARSRAPRRTLRLRQVRRALRRRDASGRSRRPADDEHDRDGTTVVFRPHTVENA